MLGNHPHHKQMVLTVQCVLSLQMIWGIVLFVKTVIPFASTLVPPVLPWLADFSNSMILVRSSATLHLRAARLGEAQFVVSLFWRSKIRWRRDACCRELLPKKLLLSMYSFAILLLLSRTCPADSPCWTSLLTPPADRPC